MCPSLDDRADLNYQKNKIGGIPRIRTEHGRLMKPPRSLDRPYANWLRELAIASNIAAMKPAPDCIPVSLSFSISHQMVAEVRIKLTIVPVKGASVMSAVSVPRLVPRLVPAILSFQKNIIQLYDPTNCRLGASQLSGNLYL